MRGSSEKLDTQVDADPAVESLGGETTVSVAPVKASNGGQSGGGMIDWTILVILVAIWGSTYAFIKVGVSTIDPFWLVVGRMSVGTVCVSAFLGAQHAVARRSTWATQPAKLDAKSIWMFASVGIFCSALPFCFYAEGGRLADSAIMAICNGATPMFTAVFAHFFLKGDRLTMRRVVGVSLGFAGLVVLVGPAALTGAGGSVLGIALGIAGAALFAVGNIITRLAPRLSPVVSSIIINLAGTLAIVPVALLVAPFPVAPSAASIFALLMLGLFSTAVGMILYVWLIQRAGPMFVSLITYLSPLWATVVGVTLMGESLEWSMLGALGLILVGVAVANQRMKPRTE